VGQGRGWVLCGPVLDGLGGGFRLLVLPHPTLVLGAAPRAPHNRCLFPPGANSHCLRVISSGCARAPLTLTEASPQVGGRGLLEGGGGRGKLYRVGGWSGARALGVGWGGWGGGGGLGGSKVIGGGGGGLGWAPRSG